MSKKDYEKIARFIRESRGTGLEMALDTFAVKFADDAKVENPRFDADKFLDACGVPE